MPFVTQSYLNYLESQLGGGGGGQGGIDIPPADTSPGTTTAPWANPAAGGPGSYPAPSPTGTPQTPPQWGGNTNFVPMPIAYPGQEPSPGPINDTMPLPEADPGTTPPYVYNDPYGTGQPGNVPIQSGTPYGGVPAPSSGEVPPPSGTSLTPGDPNDQVPLPTQGGPPDQPPGVSPGQTSPGSNIHNVLGNFFRSLGAFFPGDPGGWGQPMGFFGVQPQNPIGMFGVGGPNMPAGGGSYFGGPSGRDPFGIAGSTYGLGSGGGGSIAGLDGKLAWHEAQPMFGGRTLAQVARENPELLPGLVAMTKGAPEGSPAQQTGGGHAPVSST